MGSWDLNLRSLVWEPHLALCCPTSSSQSSGINFCTSLCEILLIMLLSWESTLLLFYSTNSLCLSTPSSINTFSTKGFQQFQSLEFSYHGFENITLLVFGLLLSHSFSISLLDSSLYTLFFFSTYSLPLWEHLSPNDNIYLPIFWKLQLRLCFPIPQISTWMCTDTSSSILPALVFTVIFAVLLRCHHYSPTHWSQEPKHDP